MWVQTNLRFVICSFQPFANQGPAKTIDKIHLFLDRLATFQKGVSAREKGREIVSLRRSGEESGRLYERGLGWIIDIFRYRACSDLLDDLIYNAERDKEPFPRNDRLAETIFDLNV